MKDISQAINFVEVLADYPQLKTADLLYKHLEAACVTANAVRKVIRASSTHLSANKYDNETFYEVSYQIDEMRRNFDKQCFKVPNGADKPQKILDIWAQHIEVLRMGDCPEYTMLALKKLQIFYPKLLGEVFALEKDLSIEDEDAHEFLVIGRDPKSDPADYSTWGSAVICDAWMGEVFSVEDLPERLKCFRPFMRGNRQINHLGDFDPDKHSLVLDFTLKPAVRAAERKKISGILKDSTLFHQSKKQKSNQDYMLGPKMKKQKI